MQERVRLHISPLTPELLSTILPPSLQSQASNISYHSLQNFPERNYGYVELPAMEADKIKKKLHGSILKGSKLRVEEARPEGKRRASTEEEEKQEQEAERNAKRIAKKRKREEGVLPGFELPNDRKVKRGWTEPVSTSKSGKAKDSVKGLRERRDKKTKAQSSSFGDEPECLFRTKLPLNTKASLQKPTVGDKKLGKFKKGKSDREAVVHEFSNTTKHASFLRENNSSNGKNPTSEYVEGKGWFDKDGQIIEQPPKERRPKKSEPTEEPDRRKLRSMTLSENPDLMIVVAGPETHSEPVGSEATSSSGTTSSDDDSEPSEAEESDGAQNGPARDHHTEPLNNGNGPIGSDSGDESDATSSSGTSSSSSSSKSKDNTSVPTLNVPSTEPTPTEVHPLEALFKKPKLSLSDTPRKPHLEVKTSFSFFDSDDKDDESTNRLMPQTPFTQRDLQYRSIRSAAPTPDTAAPNKSGFGNVWGRDVDSGSDGDGAEDEKADRDAAAYDTFLAEKSTKADGETDNKPPESDFAKWFWEHRGETNRAWKKRKREATKVKRQNDNKRRGRSTT